MKTIYFLGLENVDGLKLLKNGKIGTLTFNNECDGWNNPNADDIHIQNMLGDQLIECGDPLMPCIRKQEETNLHVFDSKINIPANQTSANNDEAVVTYQVHWGEDQ